MLTFLDKCPKFLFFTGKGGVGKTSLSCASAVYLADQGKKVLLVSTDPASNVGEVFGVTIGNRVTPVPGAGALSALEINPEEAARRYRERLVGPVRGVLPDDVVRGIEEQLSGGCTVEIAAFDEFTALLTDEQLIAGYDHVLFDTAPTGHTIRLLKLPGAWSGFIETNPEGASCLGPLAGLLKQKSLYDHSVSVLSDPKRTRLILVCRGQRSSLSEVFRTAGELASTGLLSQYLVINGLFPLSQSQGDPLAESILRRERQALSEVGPQLSRFPVDRLPLKEYNMVGVDHLRSFFSGEPFRESPSVSPAGGRPAGLPVPEEDSRSSPLEEWLDTLSVAGKGLVMMVGKGGVGKTTMAAAIAVGLARRGFPVHLTTTDPAAHLSRTLSGLPDRLTVSRIDPEEETARYARSVLSDAGKNLDASGLRMLEEDLRSPCTEEVAVFQAFSRTIALADTQFVIMDTAPTGHTLLLLDATGAYHREVVRHTSGEGPVLTPFMRLLDPDRTKIIIVTLLETTPVQEAFSLEADLLRAGITPWGWIFNQSLMVSDSLSPLLGKRALSEERQWEEIRGRIPHPVAFVPVRALEPVGEKELSALLTDGKPPWQPSSRL